MSERKVTLTINGRSTGPRVVPETLSLLDFLHDELGLTGTKFCCGIAVCRACTVSVRRTATAPSNPVLACTTPVVAVDGQRVETVEGLAVDGEPNPLQQAFLDGFAFQCGYCTPGFLMGTTVLMERLAAAPVPRDQLDAEIDDAVGAHVCRCTGYVRYHAAIKSAILATPGLVR